MGPFKEHFERGRCKRKEGKVKHAEPFDQAFLLDHRRSIRSLMQKMDRGRGKEWESTGVCVCAEMEAVSSDTDCRLRLLLPRFDASLGLVGSSSLPPSRAPTELASLSCISIQEAKDLAKQKPNECLDKDTHPHTQRTQNV